MILILFIGSKDYEEFDPDDLVGTRCIHCAITSCPDGQTLQNGDCYNLVTLDEIDPDSEPQPALTSEPVRTSRPVGPSEPVKTSKPDETPRSISSASILGLETRIIWTTVFVQVMIFLQVLWTVISFKYLLIIYLLIALCDDWNMDYLSRN